MNLLCPLGIRTVNSQNSMIQISTTEQTLAVINDSSLTFKDPISGFATSVYIERKKTWKNLSQKPE